MPGTCCPRIAYLIAGDDPTQVEYARAIPRIAFYYDVQSQVFLYDSTAAGQPDTPGPITALLESAYAQGFRCFVGPDYSGVLRNAIPFLQSHPDVQLVSPTSGAPGLGAALPSNAYRFIDADASITLTVASIQQTGVTDTLILQQAGDTLSQTTAQALVAALGGTSKTVVVNLSSQGSANASVAAAAGDIAAYQSIYLATIAGAALPAPSDNLSLLLQALASQPLVGKNVFSLNTDQGSGVAFPVPVVVASQGFSASPLLTAFGVDATNINTDTAVAQNRALAADATRWLRSCRTAFEGLTGYIRFCPRNQDRVATVGVAVTRQPAVTPANYTTGALFPVLTPPCPAQ